MNGHAHRIISVVLVVTLAITGCTLDRVATVTAPAATVTPVAVALAETSPPPQPTPTIEPSPTERAATQPFVLSGCTIQHPEWPVHVVKAGDTLARIAAQAGTTVDVLVQANCLADANRIDVGQRLHVPLAAAPPNPPHVDIGIQPAHVCVVVPNAGQASIFGADASGSPIAILVGAVRFVRHADNAYIVELPSGIQSWVSAMEAHLVGSTCPGQSDGGGTHPKIPSDLPVIRNGDAPPGNLCSVVKDSSPGTRYIYGGTSSAHAPIAIMGDYLLYLADVSNGYEVVLPGWGMTGWIPAAGVSLYGATCPAN